MQFDNDPAPDHLEAYAGSLASSPPDPADLKAIIGYSEPTV
jgi:hypothetical protein